MIRTYIDWVLDVPWSATTQRSPRSVAARTVLDEDHYDLDKVKERIVEYLAVQKLKTQNSPTAQIKGPFCASSDRPRGQDLARAIDRARHEPEVRAHLARRRARRSRNPRSSADLHRLDPGRIVQALKQAGAMNPVFMLDEIDKITSGFQGDPAAALLEVLDPSQNHSFRDHYLEINVDLSRVLFMRPRISWERSIPRYSTAWDHLARRLQRIREAAHRDAVSGGRDKLEENASTAAMVRRGRSDPAHRQRLHARSGRAESERQNRAVARKIAAKLASAQPTEGPAEAGPYETVVVAASHLRDYLGPPRFHDEVSFPLSRPGVATGVAWTETGGDVLFVEARLLPSAITI